jgi:crotonobetainyl-CoA:carnitine CoA-transferase CaiB-like acyl-CoA transferase
VPRWRRRVSQTTSCADKGHFDARLSDLRIIDHSTGIAGPYCSKLFADAGADVIKVEPPGGDPLRAWSASGADLGGRDGALFRYLNASKRSIVGALDAPLVASADLVIEDLAPGAFDRLGLCERHPGLVVLSITPFGLAGPLAGRPATDFTLQAEGGSIGARGRPGAEPFQAGGRISAWAGGCFAAVAALAALRRARASGHGEHIDFSLLETTALVTNCYVDLMWGILGRPPVAGLMPSLETPSIEPTRDGYVGFTTYSAQQMSDFLLLIERPDLRESGEFAQIVQRLARLPEWEAIVHAYTRAHTTAEIVEAAQLLRIPVAPILNGASVLQHEPMQARGVFAEDPSGCFLRPLPPYRIDGRPPAPPRPPRGSASMRGASSRARPCRRGRAERPASRSPACASSTRRRGGPGRSRRRGSPCSGPTSCTSSRSVGWTAAAPSAVPSPRCARRGGSAASSSCPPTRTSAASRWTSATRAACRPSSG